SARLTVGVHHAGDTEHPIVWSTEIFPGPFEDATLFMPLEFVFPQRVESGAGAAADHEFALLVRVQSTAGTVRLETVARLANTGCEETGRFVFGESQRAAGPGLAYTPADPFHVQLVGACEGP